MDHLPGFGELVECPYNPAHQVMKARIQTHLVKCRKSHAHVHKKRCPFNSTHLVNEPELNIHMLDCPDRATFDRYRYTAQTNLNTSSTSTMAKTIAHRDATPVGGDYSQLDGDECWDDTNAPTYDPQQYVRNAPVLRTLNLAPPAERAQFRDQEIKRLNRMQMNDKK